jgi:hypothetical protein
VQRIGEMKTTWLATTTFASGIILVSCVKNETNQVEVTNPSTILIAEQTTVRLGEPVKITVTLTNHSQTNVEVDGNGILFGCFDIRGPDGQRLSYVGFDGQTFYKPVPIAPSSTKAMAEHFDLADSYVFPKPGRYSIRYRKMDPACFPDSDTVTIDITPGELSEVDKTVLQLLTVNYPKRWHITKSERDTKEVQPFGRSIVPGHYVYIRGGIINSGENLCIWLTKAEAPIATERTQGDSGRAIQSEYLGHARGMHVYVAQGTKTPTVWPNAIKDISRALNIVKK